MSQKTSIFINEFAKVTCRGIFFRGCYYSCAKAIREKWFELARNYGGWTIQVEFNPENLQSIFLRLEEFDEFEQCNIIIKQKQCQTKLDKYFQAILKLKREKVKAQNQFRNVD
ncbi:hypothetical protein [Paenibacillus agricola]|uniref:Uncharacterized protein n=1 Tax=Paenibacillus agricola TaxID=2716264 RepID=A0ABX0J6N5_9BACL|nr:hypothetical protein [Paenibacillus agricola]NHN31613.1 hypothetical protein [Paenibacillus agricola]